MEINITEIREKLGLTLNAFARKVGATERTVWNWERGSRPDRYHQNRIEKLVKKSLTL
jgi:DNA-binding transcriptional regulator YiaG